MYTNPCPDTYVTHKDKVFILGIDIEQEKVPKIIPDITLAPSKVDVYSTYELFQPLYQTPSNKPAAMSKFYQLEILTQSFC